jgi:YHS domain-containing protein
MNARMKQFIAGLLLAGLLVVGLMVMSSCKKKSEPAAPAPAPVKTVEVALVSIEQTTCPIMGGKINKAVFAEYKGKKVYFCCAGCKPKFEKDPEKYIAKLPQFKN